MHAVWVLAHADGSAAVDSLFALAATDSESSVQAQAIRAIADLTDPVITQYRLDTGPGDAEVAERLAKLAEGKGARVLLEVVIALGRLRWQGAPDWLAKTLTGPDPDLTHAALSHAVIRTLRQSQNWPAVLQWLDQPTGHPLRAVALRAIADQAVPELVDGLLERLRMESNGLRQLEYADMLARVHRKPGPWTYWGFRPAPRPPNTIDWDRTEAIEQALDRMLRASNRMARLSVLRRMQREKITTQFETLEAWLRDEREEVSVHALLDSLREHKPGDTRGLLETTVRTGQIPTASRLMALAIYAAGLDEASEGGLLTLAGSLEDGPVLAEAIRQIGKRPTLNAASLLVEKLNSSEPQVRVAALETITVLKVMQAADPVRRLLTDRDVGVRRAAAATAGQLGDEAASTALLELAKDADSAVRRASLESLRRLKEPRAVPLAVAALADSATEGAALACLVDLGGPLQAGDVVEFAKRNPSAEVVPQVLRMLTVWAERPDADQPRLDEDVAKVQGSSGMLARWRTTGPLPADAAAKLAERFTSATTKKGLPDGERPVWKTVFASGIESRIALDPADDMKTGAAWLAYTDVSVSESTEVQFLTAGTGALRIWLNGHLAQQLDEARPSEPGSDRFDVRLDVGTTRVVVHVSAAMGNPAFQLRFRRKTSTAEHERLTQAALTMPGNADRGRALFFNAERSQCVKCHRVADQGERIGPELTGIGNRFSRIHLVESVLQPSRTVAPSFQAVTVVLSDGQSVTGVAVAEDERRFTLADNQGKKHVLEKSDIEAREPQEVSVMPEGLEKPFSVEEFVDLIAFLVSQKEGR
jgi:putative heme-binding domain-containing protein